jgi:hypothetical protein
VLSESGHGFKNLKKIKIKKDVILSERRIYAFASTVTKLIRASRP